jgi:hypothetical protein
MTIFQPGFFRTILQAIFCGALFFTVCCRAGNYTNFDVSIYIPVGVVRNLDHPETLSNQWNVISSQLKVDKVYIEVQRDRQTNSDETLERVKNFFLDHGVKVAGGMAASDGSIGGQFKTFCYTDPADRAFIKSAAELAARHFDELIQDDFFFNTTKFAKAPEMMLFEWSAMLRPIPAGERAGWENLHTSFDYNQLLDSFKTNNPANLE